MLLLGTFRPHLALGEALHIHDALDGHLHKSTSWRRQATVTLTAAMGHTLLAGKFEITVGAFDSSAHCHSKRHLI